MRAWTMPARVTRAAKTVDGLLTPDRLHFYPSVLLVLGVLSLVVNTAFGDFPRTLSGQEIVPDFLARWTGGHMLLTGQTDRLYDPSAQLAVQQTVLGAEPTLSWFVSPPLAALLFAPFAALPYPAGAAVWTAVSLGLLVGALVLLRPLVPGVSSRHWGLVTLIVASSQPVFEVVGSGQDSALSLFVWVCGLRMVVAGRDLAAGVILATGLFKPQLFLLVPVVLLLGRSYSALCAWTATATAIAGCSVALVGLTGIRSWIQLFRSPLYRQGVQEEQAWKMQGIPSLLSSLAPPGSSRIALVVEGAGLALAAAVVIAFAVRLGRSPQTPILGRWMFALLTTIGASPHLLVYDLVLVIPVLLYLFEHGNRRILRLSCTAIFLLSWTVAARHALASFLPWPAGALVGAAWTAVPLALLWLGWPWRPARPALRLGEDGS